MDSLLLGSVVGSGYLLSENGKNNRQQNINNDLYKESSQNSIYSSNHLENVLNEEKKNATCNFEKSSDSLNTNIIPPGFNNKIINKENTPVSYLKNNDSYVSELSGQNVNRETFKSTPYFGSHVRQITASDANFSILENHTGVEEFSKKKCAPVPLFEPTKDINITYGTQPASEEIADRIIPSRYKTNELPFQKINVGPGLGKGYNSEPSGGFHTDTRGVINNKTIDQLRPSSNPQISYKGRVISGKALSGKTSKKPNISKNRPDTYYINSSDRYFTTTGAHLKAKQQPHILVKDTNRKDSKQLTGSAAPAYVKNHSKRSLYKKSNKNNFKTDGPRNAYNKDNWNNEEFGDYGKKGLNLPLNERDITGKRTHVSNITTVVKALIAPVIDLMKTTKKENIVGNARQSGNIGTGGVSKNVVWDPNDITKTTIKETNIHDNRTGNINAEQKGVAWDPNDVTRTTIKETNIHDNRTGNINVDQKGVAWDPNDVTRTTIKETNIHDTRTGNLNANNKGTVLDTEKMKFRTTIRETLTPEDVNVNMKVRSRQTVHDPNDITRTTIKETNIHDNRTGNLAGPIKLAVYDPNDVTRTTMKETIVYNKRNGNIGGTSKGAGYLTNIHEAPNTNRQFSSDFEYEGIADGERQGGLGYLTNEKEAPNTNRQFTSDYEYEGTAGSMYKRPSTYDTAYNTRTNASREKTLEGRKPTCQKDKIASGKDTINIDVKKLEGDYINTRELNTTKVYNSIKELKPCSITQEKQPVDYSIMGERIDPELLNAYRENPYTQSLASYTY